MKKPKLKKYPTGGSKGFIPDKLVHYVGQGETPYTREQLGAMGYNYETTTGGFDEYSMGDNRRFYKTVLPNSPGWNNPENPYLTNTAKPAVAKVGHKTGPYPSYGSPEYIQAHPEYTPPKPRIPTFAGGGEFAPIPEKDSLYIEDRLKKDPYLSAKYKYKVVEDRKKGDVLYRTMPNGKDVPVNFNNMKELDRQAYKVKMDRDLQSTGQKPIYNVFAPPTFKHGGMKLPKYLPGGEYESTSMIEDYRAEDGSNFWDGANGQESYYKSQEPIASAADQQQINNTQINNNQLSSGQYAAIGSASATGSANIYNAYNSPRTSEWQKNQQAGKAIEKTETQVAGAINPIVGMIHGTVSGIMDKSTAEATKTDSQGNLVNRKQAKNQAIGRAFADPMAMIPTMISTGFNRDRYANQIEADAKARIAEEQAPMLAAAEAKRNMYYTYAQGGVHSGMPNAEVEKEEVMRMPNGQTKQVDGPSHDNGGVPVNIPDGTQIFSDRLKDPNSKKTFAKMAEKYKTNKQDKILNNPKADKTAKSTAELVAQIKQAKLDKLFETQEQLKQTRLNKYAQKLGLDPNTMFPNGGIKNNEYIPYNPSSTIQQINIEDPYVKASIVNNFNKKKELDELNYQRNLGTWLHPYQEGKEFFNDVYKKDSTSVEDKYNKYAKYAKGGTKLPKYYAGATHGGIPGLSLVDLENIKQADQSYSNINRDVGKDQAWKEWSNQNWDPTLGQTERDARNQFNSYYNKPVVGDEAQPISNGKTPYVPNPNDPYEQAMAAGKEFEQPAKQVNPKTGNYDWVEPTANTLMQNAGNIAYLAGEGKKYDKQDFYKYSPELYNPADALRQADIEARVNRGKLKDASGGNAGALMSNLTQSQAINTLLKSKIRTDAANQNAGTLNDAQVRNIQGKYNVDDINARNKGQALTNYYKAISGIGQNTSASYRSYKAGQMDRNTAEQWGKVFKDMGLDMSNSTHWEIIDKRFKKDTNKK